MTNHFFELSLLVLFAISCNIDEPELIDEPEVVEEFSIDTPDWTETTHSNLVDPNYSMVFPNKEVLRIDITINTDNWNAMQSDLDANLGSGATPESIDFTPVWVTSSLEFNGKEWYKVGIRYKGNSSLLSAYRNGEDKFPFKLDFDEFEDSYPDIKNQRFYGFKQLNLGNNNADASFMREKVGPDLFREFGVPSARTSFCAVYLDRGNGSNYLGMYTLVEEVDDSVIESQFTNSGGNLYKPDGDGASFASGTFIEADMYKKSNEDLADYSDVQTLYDLLHSTLRTSNEVQWRSELEAALNVDNYLKYLAANTVIQNWDTYGIMTHNYFLFNHNEKLVWIPWDNNEAFQNGKRGGALSLSLSEVSNDWPLIRYIMDVTEYENIYKSYVKDFTEVVFEPNKMNELYSGYEALIGSYAIQESSNFTSAVSTLKSHALARSSSVNAYLQ